ncbi:hypothetical protein IVB36_14645 [Bradyrhizobium sp. 35]|uniref:hypothetical protein n=1 Tax=Bradyrhizobium sp. 35 TaxID=2782670 RepID=UPI001FF9B361|nr:hypothetical protein [Bradyrhizobium sp. 35]MCK1452097.1 hypothetical protein [Bradyrhizobium sp. 35]
MNIAIDELLLQLTQAALLYQTDKRESAQRSLAAVIAFLRQIEAPDELRTPLLEALQIVVGKNGGKKLPKEVLDMVIASVAVTDQLQMGVPLDAALLKVSEAGGQIGATKLKNFRNNMMSKNTPKGALDFYSFMVREARASKLSPAELANISLDAVRTKMKAKS